MISRSTRRGILLMSLLAGFSYWLADRSDTNTDNPIAGLDTRLDYALENFEMRAFDEKGKPILRLQAPRLTNEAATKIGFVEAPRLEVRHEGFLWHIIADSATISEDQERMFLDGAVRIERTGASDTDRVDIDARDVTLLVEQRIAESAEAVRLADLSGTLEARGFRVDMLKDEFQLHSDVQGVYDVPQ